MFSHLHPMLLHNDMLQGNIARDPTSPRVDWSHISCLAESTYCTSSHAKFPCHRKNKAYRRGTGTHLLWGLQKLREQSFFWIRESLAVLNHGMTEGFWLAGQRENFPLLWEVSGRLCRKPLLQSSTDLVDGACSCWAGRSSHFIYLPGEAKLISAAQTAFTQPRGTRHRFSPVLRTGLSSSTERGRDWPVTWPWITHSSNKPPRGGWGEEALPFLPHPHKGTGTWVMTALRKGKIEFNTRFVVSPKYYHSVSWSGIENKIRSCGWEPARFRET